MNRMVDYERSLRDKGWLSLMWINYAMIESTHCPALYILRLKGRKKKNRSGERFCAYPLLSYKMMGDPRKPSDERFASAAPGS